MPSPPKTVEAFAPAKINLTLHVTGQRADGYHLLDSLVMFADVGDRLRLTAAETTSLTITGTMARGAPVDDSNSIVKAAEYIGLNAATILEKNLPSAAGIGGGTSDAAAALRGLCDLYDRELPPAKDLTPLGADVPVCLAPQAQRMRGIGEDVIKIEGLPKIWAVLVNPGFPIETKNIFQSLPSTNNAPMPADIPNFQSAKEFCAWLWQQRNDLEAAAIKVEPRISHVLKALSETQPLLARMSGSGATCFGLYDSFASATLAELDLIKAQADWWITIAELS